MSFSCMTYWDIYLIGNHKKWMNYFDAYACRLNAFSKITENQLKISVKKQQTERNFIPQKEK